MRRASPKGIILDNRMSGAAEQSPTGLGKPECRRGSGDPNVTPQGQLETGGQAIAVDGRDERLGASHDVVVPGHRARAGYVGISTRNPEPPIDRVLIRHLLEIGARRKGLPPRSGDDPHEKVIVSREALHGPAQLVAGFAAQRVHDPGTIEGDEAFVAPDLIEN